MILLYMYKLYRRFFMIKNIIFDLGGVLIDFFPENYLKHINLKEDEIQLFKKLIWGSKTWLKGDRGDLNYEQIIEEICKNNPMHSKKLRFALENKDNSFILSANSSSCSFFYKEDLKFIFCLM